MQALSGCSPDFVSEEVKRLLQEPCELAEVIGTAMRYRMEAFSLFATATKASSLTSKTLPSIQIEAYSQRLIKWSRASPSCLIASYALIRRLGDIISPLTGHRLLLSGLLVSIKLMEDRYYTQDHYAAVGGVSMQQINDMELEFLGLLNWRVFVDVPELNSSVMEAMELYSLQLNAEDSTSLDSSSSLVYDFKQ